MPIAAIVADQQSALIGQGATAPGATKITLGTSATLDAATGSELMMTVTAFPLVVERTGGDVEPVHRGHGRHGRRALLDWLGAGLGRVECARGVCALETAPSSGSVHVLPALKASAHPMPIPPGAGRSMGFRARRGGPKSRAPALGIAFRLAEIVEHIFKETRLARPGDSGRWWRRGERLPRAADRRRKWDSDGASRGAPGDGTRRRDPSGRGSRCV
ncbi:MAG: hypothetical protein U1E87_01590 [Alphaproteobacteria bacterium]